jgi:hypothetical protein
MVEGSTSSTLVPLAGDPLPCAVSELLAGLGDGDAERAAGGFAADALCAWPAVEDDESAPRASGAGRQVAALLTADPRLGQMHLVRLCCTEGPECLLEGWILGPAGERARSFAASIQLDEAGLISRCLLFRTPAVEDAAGTDVRNRSGIDIQAAVDEYFEELGAARFEAATTFFSADCLYSHPPYRPGTPRAEFRGREELLAGFEYRGAQAWRHEIDASIQRGAHVMFEGHVLLDGTPDGPSGSFVCSATVDEEGKIRRYLATSCAPMVPRR